MTNKRNSEQSQMLSATQQLDVENARRFLELSNEWYWELDQSGCFTFCSEQIENLLGYQATELIGRKFISLLSRADTTKQDAAEFTQQQLAQKETIEGLVCGFYDNRQQLHYLELNGKPIYTEFDEWVGYHGIARVIYLQENLEKTLHNLADGISSETGNAFFRSLVTHLARLLQVDYALVGEFTGKNRDMVRVIVVSAHGEISEDFSYTIHGTPCEEVLDGKLSCYQQDVQKQFPHDPMLPDMNASSYLGAPLYTADGQINGLMAVIHSKPFAQQQYMESIFRLYVARAAAELERQQMVQSLEHIAHHDDLTGLNNRNLFHTLLDNAISRAKRKKEQIALLFLDLDHFKDINDTLGHESGDKVLAIVAKRLKESVRAEDTVARIGGDEFMVLVNEVQKLSNLQKVTQKIFERLSKPILLSHRELHVTTSIGISIYPMDGENVSTLMKHADIALYKAKANGRNCYQLYSSEMGDAITEKLNLENDLRLALSNQEFEVFFQPKININTGKIQGVEALLRWNHPQSGLMVPIKFIPLLEETGGIVPVGNWVLETAVRQIRQYSKLLDYPISISVNVSARQFRDAQFLEKLDAVLTKNDIEPELLELEITESLLVEEGEHINNLLREIKNRGIKIALDDFGTGYSSLNYLKRFPIDTVKIDRSFVKDITENKDDKILVKAIIDLANTLNLLVIAEGVETEQQLNILKEFNCPIVQGYYFSRPIPALEWEQFTKNYQ